MSEEFLRWVSEQLTWVKCVLADNPDPSFLSDIAAFGAMVVALAVPLSYEIVSRISDRYESDVVVKRYKSHFVVKYMPWVVIPNVIAAVLLRFFLRGVPDLMIWRMAAWLILGWFVLIAVSLVWFLHVTMAYASSSAYVIGKLFDDAEKQLR